MELAGSGVPLLVTGVTVVCDAGHRGAAIEVHIHRERKPIRCVCGQYLNRPRRAGEHAERKCAARS